MVNTFKSIKTQQNSPVNLNTSFILNLRFFILHPGCPRAITLFTLCLSLSWIVKFFAFFMDDSSFTIVCLFSTLSVVNLIFSLVVLFLSLTNLFFSLADLLLIGFLAILVDNLLLTIFLLIGWPPLKDQTIPTYCCTQSHLSPHPLQVTTPHLAHPMQLLDPSLLVTVLANLKHLVQVSSDVFAKSTSFSLRLLVELNCL